MNDPTSAEWERYRPGTPALESINYCLLRLDEGSGHGMTDALVPGLTCQELIGALLLGRDIARRVGQEAVPPTDSGQ